MRYRILLFILTLSSSPAFSKDILAPVEERISYLQKAEAWFTPAWIDANFHFDDHFNPADAPTKHHSEKLLTAETVLCDLMPNHISAHTGKTPKFICSLDTLDENGKKIPVLNSENEPFEIKVKFGKTNGEVFGEVLSMRLLWSLGFAADRMFYVPQTNCYGCSEDPFNKRDLDPSTLENPRIFSPTAIERKLHGDEIIRVKIVNEKPIYERGWSFGERSNLSLNPILAEKQRAERDALALLAVFINHLDNKKDNQRLFCIDPLDAQGKCLGRVGMMIQDGGSTFGSGFDPVLKNLKKVNYEAWKAMPIWKNPSICQGGVSSWGSQTTNVMRVSESGRQFLLKLLKGFSEGSLGRQRVENLFHTVNIEQRGFTAAQWADVFMKKIEEIEFPMGLEHPDFVCPP